MRGEGQVLYKEVTDLRWAKSGRGQVPVSVGNGVVDGSPFYQGMHKCRAPLQRDAQNTMGARGTPE